MLYAVIVEDQLPIQRQIALYITEANLDINIAGCCSNGKEGLECILATKPDIVITDIRMPLMDGLELIREVRARQIACNFIILSGYSEFDYARQAIQLNVSEYLLKPLRREEFNKILVELAMKLQRENHIQLIASLQNLLTKTTKSATPPIPNLNYENYSLLLISNYNLSYSDWETLFIQLEDSFEHMPHFFLSDVSSSELIVLLCHNATTIRSILYKRIEKCMSQFPNALAGIVSPTFSNIVTLHLEYLLNKGMLKKYRYFQKNTLILRNDQETFPPISNDHLSNYVKTQIEFFLREVNFIGFKKTLLLLIEDWEKNSLYASNIFNQLNELFFLFFNCSHFPFLKDYDFSEMATSLVSTNSYTILGTQLMDYVDQIQDVFLKSTPLTTTQDVIDFLTSHINNNYVSNLTVAELSSLVSLTPAYLSRIFKKHLNVSPMEYIINVRMEKAKTLLTTCPNLTLKQIAEQVGYCDSFHFSKSFKQVFGLAPSEYKKMKVL